MKNILRCFLVIIITPTALAFHFPSVKFTILTPPPSTLFYGETAYIKIRMTYDQLRYYQQWFIPAGVSLQAVDGRCPALNSQWLDWQGSNYCDFNLVIYGGHLGTLVISAITYHLYSGKHHNHWDYYFSLPTFSLVVIPHPLALSNLPRQYAIAGMPFYFSIKDFIHYYTENVEAGSSPSVKATPLGQNGLYFDPNSFALIGTPVETGSYLFQLSVYNQYAVLSPVQLVVEVGVNPRDKPVFKSDIQAISAFPGEIYRLNLADLLTTSLLPGLHFRIDTNHSYPSWLLNWDEHGTVLSGLVPLNESGQESEITLIASSNTGGDSLPLTITIPVAVDSGFKPQLESVRFNKVAGEYFSHDLREQIQNSLDDPTLELTIDEIKPTAPWLSFSSYLLEGTIPQEAVGELYTIKFHAATRRGGQSDLAEVALSVAIDQERKPRFKVVNQPLPQAYAGQAFVYDFAANEDVLPTFKDAPYTIEFANADHPAWLRLEGTQLIADEVIAQSNNQKVINFYVKIHNKPGGDSEVNPLHLYVIG